MKSPVILYREQFDIDIRDEVEAMMRYFPVATNRTDRRCMDAFVIARYSALPFYRELEDDLFLMGSTMINCFREHNYVADISNWYWDLEGITPRTWFKMEDVPDDGGPFVLKGETNSRKHLWDTHMFAQDKDAAKQVMFRLMDDSLITYQGICIRQYVPLKKFFDGLRGMPITEEYRFFIYRGRVLCGGYYWSSHVEDFENGPPSADNVPREFLEEVMRRIGNQISFYVVDVARTHSGEWMVVELNDGQMSGLSENDPDVLYRALFNALREERKPIRVVSEELAEKVRQQYRGLRFHAVGIAEYPPDDGREDSLCIYVENVGMKRQVEELYKDEHGRYEGFLLEVKVTGAMKIDATKGPC